ncbi:hypothetical protein TYRP_013183 [Tyrophagus putrescentiae]|nr:hypothetical protein TYRP_013183 [Tyrophagus putrescentiae]
MAVGGPGGRPSSPGTGSVDNHRTVLNHPIMMRRMEMSASFEVQSSTQWKSINAAAAAKETRVIRQFPLASLGFHCIITLIIATLPAEADLAQVQAAQKKREASPGDLGARGSVCCQRWGVIGCRCSAN